MILFVRRSLLRLRPAGVIAVLAVFLFAGGAEKNLIVALRPLAVAEMGLLHSAPAAVGDDLSRLRVVHLHANTLIKYIAEPFKIAASGLRILSVCYDPPVELIDIFETFLLQKAGQFFAANTTGAVGQNFFPLQLVGMFPQPVREFAKVSDIRAYGILEPPQLGFVVIATVDDDDPVLLHGLVEFTGRKALTGRVLRVYVLFRSEAEGDDFFANFDRELRKDMIVGRIDLEFDFGGLRVLPHGLHVGLRILDATGHRSVDPFFPDDDAAAQFQLFTTRPVSGRVGFRILDLYITVIEKDLEGRSGNWSVTVQQEELNGRDAFCKQGR